ncbi:MAG: hypothetical protein KDG50_07670 [Chromatiales bacterium]|nr:hypothetical protein [Chromatiales bacterium]
MAEEKYNLIFEARNCVDADLAGLRERLLERFRLDERQLQRMFSGADVVLKRELTAERADRLATSLREVGAQCRLEPVGGAIRDNGARYNLVIAAHAKPDSDLDLLRKRLSRIISVPAFHLHGVLAGREIVVRRRVTAASAHTLAARLAAAGIPYRLEPLDHAAALSPDAAAVAAAAAAMPPPEDAVTQAAPAPDDGVGRDTTQVLEAASRVGLPERDALAEVVASLPLPSTPARPTQPERVALNPPLRDPGGSAARVAWLAVLVVLAVASIWWAMR